MKKLFNPLIYSFYLLLLFLLSSCDNPLFISATGLYKVEFAAGGGTTVESVRTDCIKEAPFTSRADYTFGGWYKNSDFSGEAVTFPLDIKEDTILYAKWFQEFNVTFECNGGDEIESYKTGIVQSEPETSRTNYIFDGWYLKSDFTGNKVNFPYTVTKPVTLYAKWLRTYQVSFETNGGSEISGFRTAVIESVQDPVKDDNVFIGWYKDSTFKNPVEFPYTLTDDTTLYAKWKQKYTVSFETNGGTNVSSYKATEVESAPPVSRAGYAFIAWYTDIDLTEEAVFPFEVIRDTTLYAKWQKIYTVTFVTNGGTSVSPATVLTIETTPVSEKTDASLEGWYTDPEFAEGTKVIFPYTVTGDITFYAKWQAVQYTITYYPNGATGGDVPASVSVDKGSEYIVKDNTGSLEKTDYCFLKWNTKADGSGTSYIAGSKISVMSDINFYAQWARDFSSWENDENRTAMVYVAGGTFSQGGSGATPIHTVTLTQDFYIGKFEVTYELWKEVMDWAKAQEIAWNVGSASKGVTNNDTFTDWEPTTNVSWYEAITWCNAYSEMKGLTPYYYKDSSYKTVYRDCEDKGYPYCKKSANGYRLPTESEWEYAAKGGLNSKSYTCAGSNSPGDVAWYGNNAGGETHPVGTKIANSLGIYDMSGNVREWCGTSYYSYSSDAQTNPNYWAYYSSDGNFYKPIYRGGSWNDYDYEVYYRNYSSDGTYGSNVNGFRVARNAE